MDMITFESSGDFSKLTGFLERLKEGINIGILDKYGRAGVKALQEATPKDTGLAASSWYYETENRNGRAVLRFLNSDIENYVPVAVILQYGHATKNGGWVEGVDYINPALKPIFDNLAEAAWKEVTK